jgi:hypothetical protein
MFRCRFHVWILVVGFTAAAVSTRTFAQQAAPARGDFSEQDPGFDDYQYEGDYRLPDRWWRIAPPGLAADDGRPRTTREWSPLVMDEGDRTDLPRQVTVPEAYSIEEELYGDHRPYYTRVSPRQDIQSVPDYSDPFRWQAPTLRPNYILPPVPFFAETLPEQEYRRQPAYYYDYKNYYEGGGYSRDDEADVGIRPR